MENNRPRVRVAGILEENGKLLLIEHTKNEKRVTGCFRAAELTGENQ